ncbi:FAD-dependent oxidoreductase [Paludisphaera mucosa]|uniref:FAD-dependent monooxygenase n=1 Tax=Paludisphaera mucosa TaxID=3030827 RepID=A0ABT6FAN5_9BACT|nr:FAD-dependent monooxygenase [Paludisphaera mucosa]MDG3004653.1 FAD-dependent monooxygenase [Paludisphaera mucosa]
MSETKRPLIVGAGPVGLGAALFLARQGVTARVVDQRAERALESKALAVNPRTLEILEPSGVTRRMLELGRRIHGAQLHRKGRVVATISFPDLHPRYPFMLALSQATTERLLAEALTALGGRVERGTKLTACRSAAEEVEAVLEPASGGTPEVFACSWLLAADGAHSIARRQLGIAFDGSSFAEPWYLADAPLRTDLADDRAHVALGAAGGFLFLLPVVDDAHAVEPGGPIWRVLGNRPDPLSRLAELGTEATGPPVWESSFHIAHRIDATLAAGGVYFAGDAAHVHSPMGARGMNLGIEDAWVFSELVRTGRLADYDALRRPVDARVVRQVEIMSRMVAAESTPVRLLRNLLIPVLTRIGPLRDRMVRTLTGLDHELPRFDGPGAKA